MAEVVPPTLSSPPDAPVPRHRLASDMVLHWRGLLAFSLLGAVGVMGPDITPSQYFDIYHYIPRYVLLALSIGFGLSAVRSGRRMDRLLGIAVLVVGGYLLEIIITSCWP